MGALAKWQGKAQELATLCQVTVADFLEREANATDLAQGFDIADYLLLERNQTATAPAGCDTPNAEIMPAAVPESDRPATASATGPAEAWESVPETTREALTLRFVGASARDCRPAIDFYLRAAEVRTHSYQSLTRSTLPDRAHSILG
jgi:hypothetical protein